MKILAFASARDQAGFSEIELEVDPAETPRGIFARIAPGLAPESFRAAVDFEYWDWDRAVGTAGEMAIIPPVSGG
jgi:molybdopterin converting factor small subunit